MHSPRNVQLLGHAKVGNIGQATGNSGMIIASSQLLPTKKGSHMQTSATHAPWPEQPRGHAEVQLLAAATGTGVDPRKSDSTTSQYTPVKPRSHAHVSLTVHDPRDEQLSRHPAAHEAVSHVMPTKPMSHKHVLLPVQAPRELQFPGHTEPVAAELIKEQSAPSQSTSHAQVPFAHEPCPEQFPAQPPESNS